MAGFFAASAASAARRSSEAGAAADRAARSAAQARTKTDFLQADIEKLLMITEALWMILKEQHGYTDDELINRIEQIDMRDGKLDGKVATDGPVACPGCGRTMIGKRPVCLYCGQEVLRSPFQR